MLELFEKEKERKRSIKEETDIRHGRGRRIRNGRGCGR